MYETILVNKQTLHSSLERDQTCNKDLVILTKPKKIVKKKNIHGGWYGLLRSSIPSL